MSREATPDSNVSKSKTALELISPKIYRKQQDKVTEPELKPPENTQPVDPTKSRWVILHYRRSKILWDWLILSLTFYTAVVVPLVTAFHIRSQSVIWMLIDSLFDFLFLLEIIINFHTSYVSEEGKLITNLKKIRIKYATTWFFIDLLSSLPYETLNFLLGQYYQQRSTALLGALRTCKLLRLVRIARDVDRYLQHTWATLVALVFLLLIIAHWMACGWYAIALKEVRSYMIKLSNLSSNLQQTLENRDQVKLPVKNWLLRLSEDIDQQFVYDITTGTLGGGPPVYTTYTSTMYFTMTSVTSAGFGNVAADTAEEMLYCIFILFLGALLFATILGNVTNILQQINAKEQEFSSHLRAIKAFAELYELPPELTEAVSDYVTYKWMVTHGIDSEQVLNYFPEHKQAEIRVALHKKVLKKQPVFKSLSDNGIWIIAKDLKKSYAAPGDVICDRGEQLDAVYFIISGSLEVSQDGAIIALLTNNNSFGTYFWSEGCDDITHMRSEVTVKSLTYTTLDYITSSSLVEAMDKFPSINRSFRTKLHLTFDLRRSFSFRTLTSVKWEQEAKCNPAVARKQERLRKWLRKTKARSPANCSIHTKTSGKPSLENDKSPLSNIRIRFAMLLKKIRHGIGFLRKNEVKPTVRSLPEPQHGRADGKNEEVEIDGNINEMEENQQKTENTQERTKQENVAAGSQFKCRKCGKVFYKNCSVPNRIQSNLLQNSKSDSDSATNLSLGVSNLQPNFTLSDFSRNSISVEDDDVIIAGKCFQVAVDETGKEEWIETGTTEFSLEEKKWMKFEMKQETRNMLLSLLDLKLNFKTSLNALETKLSLLQNKLDLLALIKK